MRIAAHVRLALSIAQERESGHRDQSIVHSDGDRLGVVRPMVVAEGFPT
jgi:hypothetical protein